MQIPAAGAAHDFLRRPSGTVSQRKNRGLFPRTQTIFGACLIPGAAAAILRKSCHNLKLPSFLRPWICIVGGISQVRAAKELAPVIGRQGTDTIRLRAGRVIATQFSPARPQFNVFWLPPTVRLSAPGRFD